MKSENNFYKIASLAAIVSAVTTFLLWLLPQFALKPENFEQSILLAFDKFYLAKQWVNFVHIFFALLAYYALSVCIKENPMAKFGFYLFLLWGITELLGVSIIIWGLNHTWREGYASADASVKSSLAANMNLFTTLWDSMFFLLLVAFFLANVVFSFLLWKSTPLGRLLSVLFLLGGLLTGLIMLSGYANAVWANPITSFIYPFLQPFSRVVLGIFLWKKSQAKNTDVNAVRVSIAQ